MSDTKEKEDQERGDEVLKRMLKTLPKAKIAPVRKKGGDNPVNEGVKKSGV